MKSFKEFCEQVKDLPVDKMSDKVDKLYGRFSGEINSNSPGSLFRASKLVDRVGKIKNAILPGI